MYHSIRGQAAIKLYVIYNVLEVSLDSIPHKELRGLNIFLRSAIAYLQLWVKTYLSVSFPKRHLNVSLTAEARFSDPSGCSC
jgi:Eukaryotic membrane protein family